MGWTLFACFGCTKKRKRPKRASSCSSSSRRRIRGYEPLQSVVPKEVDVSETLSSPREKAKDEKKARIIKKVRFNLNVVTYEPLSSQDDEHDTITNREERSGEETDHTAVASCLPLSKTIATDSKLQLYPSNYRYSSTCYDGEDEYDDDDDADDECELSDDADDECELSDDDDDDDDVGYMIDCEQITNENHDSSATPLISSATNTRLRSHYIVPVLNPIENLSQWKTVKTRKC